MAVITTIRPSTEQQAVNVILGAIGEAPISETDNLTTLSNNDANVEVAVKLLKEATRDLLTAGWRFNTLTGYEIAPTATYSWTDTDGATTVLNVFKRPTDALAWKQTKCSQMQGIELVERRSIKYTEAAAKVMVLFDRIRNRDGVEQSTYPYLYLDLINACDFEDMPESARKYATIVAARRMAQRGPVSQVQAAFTQSDEAFALRTLRREQGLSQQLNLFQTAETVEMAGRRPGTLSGGGFSGIVYPGGA